MLGEALCEGRFGSERKDHWSKGTRGLSRERVGQCRRSLADRLGGTGV